jgi:rSAM/selenodomain-associated transferase 1
VQSVAIGIFCKTPISGQSKTRLSPPLRPEDCAVLSECFIRDLARTVDLVCASGGVTGYAVYTPVGTEHALRALLPSDFRLLPQIDGGLGERLFQATCNLLNAGHAGAILLNADSPTLPASILRSAVDALRRDAVVLGPAIDGGYTLIGIAKPYARLFEDIPWSTADVHRATVERAREIGLPVVNVPHWYDIDDAQTLRILTDELLAGICPAFAAVGVVGANAPATRKFLEQLALPARAELHL